MRGRLDIKGSSLLSQSTFLYSVYYVYYALHYKASCIYERQICFTKAAQHYTMLPHVYVNIDSL